MFMREAVMGQVTIYLDDETEMQRCCSFAFRLSIDIVSGHRLGWRWRPVYRFRRVDWR